MNHFSAQRACQFCDFGFSSEDFDSLFTCACVLITENKSYEPLVGTCNCIKQESVKFRFTLDLFILKGFNRLVKLKVLFSIASSANRGSLIVDEVH